MQVGWPTISQICFQQCDSSLIGMMLLFYSDLKDCYRQHAQSCLQTLAQNCWKNELGVVSVCAIKLAEGCLLFAAGNYRFTEFLVFGAPCQLWLVGAIFIIFLLHRTIWIPIVLSVALTAATIGLPIAWVVLPKRFRVKILKAFDFKKKRVSAELLEPIKPIETKEPGSQAV